MSSIKIGAIFSLKNHPYSIGNTDVKISAFAQMTPPLLVVTEILNNPKEFDTETGEKKPKQIKCIFYSHKTHKFENYWFNPEQLTPITKKIITSLPSTDDNNLVEIKTGDEDDLKSIGIENLKKTSIIDLKKEFLNRQVILKSCDFELGKQKSTFEKNGNKSSQKINAHLDFVPPVLTVIDIKQNEEKTTYNPKSGNQKKVSSFFLLKCKWYNPSLGIFSEDFLPIEAVNLIPEIQSIDEISVLISSNKFVKLEVDNYIVLESGKILNHTYIKATDLVFNHYKYTLNYYDFFSSSYNKIDLSKVNLNGIQVSLDDIILEKVPEYKKDKQDFTLSKDYEFEKDKYYRITYKDAAGTVTERVIFVKDYIKGKIVIADCLLRNGQERHFRIKEGVLKIEALHPNLFEDLDEE
ncbi:hypothetical protein [Flavobacterium sp. W20_MBD1_R3]|uniref:hypothetical protein n=1 Tax=Flavobacterium sp. W20_MBD1_R3 TaxID=3240278 RepID=UPI003F8F6DFB